MSSAEGSAARVAVIRPARQRGPPPTSWQWAPASIPLDFNDLPPLPEIRDPALARRAVTSKNYLSLMAGRPHAPNYHDEIGCYRRLEWLGDAALNPAHAKELCRLFPEAGSGILAHIRSELHSNATQAHLGYAYGLDLRLLEPPRPSDPRAVWTPLAHNHNVIAHLFEAHIGALAEEDREGEIAGWVRAVLDRNQQYLRSRISDLVARSHLGLPLSEARNRKRSPDENNFQGGYEMDPDTKQRRGSFLPSCPFSIDANLELPKWDDRPDGAGGWHSHLVFANATIGCGGAKKRDPSRQAAMNSFFQIARKERRNMLSRIFPETTTDGAGPCADSAPSLVDKEST